MDCGVVVRVGLRIATIDPTRRASLPPDPHHRLAPEAWTDGEHPGPLRRRQVLPDDPGDALARRRDLPPLLLGFDHQEWPGRPRAASPTLRVQGLPPEVRRPDRHHLRRPSPAATDLDRLPLPHGPEPLGVAD